MLSDTVESGVLGYFTIVAENDFTKNLSRKIDFTIFSGPKNEKSHQ